MTNKGLNPEDFNPEEMAQYGFDPSIATDREAWLETAPRELSSSEHNYQDDPFEYGSTSGKTE